MELSGEHRIGAPREAVWRALNDPDVLGRAVPGCQAVERDSDSAFTAKEKARVGPVSAVFSEKVTLSDIDPPSGYVITSEGTGVAKRLLFGFAGLVLAALAVVAAFFQQTATGRCIMAVAVSMTVNGEERSGTRSAHSSCLNRSGTPDAVSRKVGSPYAPRGRRYRSGTGNGARRNGAAAMREPQTKPRWMPLLAAAGLFLACAAQPAFGVIDPHGGCGELCARLAEEDSPTGGASAFWFEAGARDVAAALENRPQALPYLRVMLWRAVEADNPEAVAALLRAGAPPNSRQDGRSGDFVLQEAARRSAALVDALLKAGAFPNVADEDGRTPLHEAASRRLAGAVAALVAAGAFPRPVDARGMSPLDVPRAQEVDENAASREEIRRLLAVPATRPPTCERLCDAAFWKTATPERIRRALRDGPGATARPAPGGGPLHTALAAGADPAFVRLLLDGGVDPNGRDARDDTPLHVAARTPGDAEALGLLLERGAILNALNAHDRTALHEAAARASTIGNMRVLLDAGANPDAVAGHTLAVTPRALAVSHPEGSDAAALILGYLGTYEISGTLYYLLISAAGSGHPDTVRLLISRGADPVGVSPLNAAAKAGNLETMRVLLEHGADPNRSKYDGIAILSGAGERPLHAAIGNPQAVALLLEHGADPDGRIPMDGATALLLAARDCDGASLALLLARGANPNARDQGGDMPLAAAMRRAANSGKVVWETWRSGCETDRSWDSPEQCLAVNRRAYEARFEPREECQANVSTLIRHGARTIDTPTTESRRVRGPEH